MQEILSKRNIGERIRNLRVNNHHSQLFVADLLNLSRSNYSQIELGNQYPTFETLYTISRYYSKSYDWLLHGFDGAAKGELSAEEIAILANKKFKEVTMAANKKTGEVKVVAVTKNHLSNYIEQLSSPDFLDKLPSFRFPLLLNEGNFYRAFKTEDRGVINTIHSGDTVIGKYLNDFSQVILNDIYIVVTYTNIILCRIYSIIPMKELLICKTDDLNNKWFTLPFNTIQEIWQAEGKYSTRLEPIISDLDVNIKKLEVTLNKIEKEIVSLKTKLLKS